MDKRIEDLRMSNRLTSKRISAAIGKAVANLAKNNFAYEYEKVGDRVDKYTILAEGTPLYDAIVTRYSNRLWTLSESPLVNQQELDEDKRRQIGEVVQAIKKEISRASDLADFAAGIPSPTFPYPPNVEQPAGGDGQLPQKPGTGSSIEVYFDYYHDCKKHRRKYTLKDIAKDINQAYGYVRQQHMLYKAEKHIS